VSDRDDLILDAIVAVVPPLLHALETLGLVARHLQPSQLDALADSVGERDTALRQAVEQFRAVAWPDRLAPFRERIEVTSQAVLRAFDGLRDAAASPDGLLLAYRALRQYSRAAEALYPVAAMLPTVSRFYLEPSARDDAALLARLDSAMPARPGTGVMHNANERGMRGGFSLYVPEYYDPATAYPLVVALHGGAGHGRQFLWSWLSEARTRGFILIAPTAIGDTWSLMEPEQDSANIERMAAYVRENWNIDPARMLLTGMSDGGTFALVSGLGDSSPFTHIAPFAASFHPLLAEMADPRRLAGLPIYLVHGALDWMFPVAMARAAERALAAAGAQVVYREVEDLSHTYPRDENPTLLDWFLAG
jgi:phospholipase/carboxylesterase